MREKTTHCSHCNEEVKARRVDATDVISDFRCVECGEFVLIEGNARREKMRREEGEGIVDHLKEFVDRFDSRGGTEPDPSILEIKNGLEDIIEEIDSIDSDIREETELDRD